MKHQIFVTVLAGFILLTPDAIGSVTIELNDTSADEDDYLCWSPVKARVKLQSPQSNPVDVLISGESAGNADLQFSLPISAKITSQSYVPKDEIDLVLPADGSWMEFLVNGKSASVDGKDVAIVIKDKSSGNTLGQLEVMVRVRKNADQLTATEVTRFLDALARLHGHGRVAGPGVDYEKYATAHRNAFNHGIHRGGQGFPLFLAWHRGFLLSLERELQAIDPRVTIPYWRFDGNSPNVFTQSFMGRVGVSGAPASNIVTFDSANPLNGWRMSTGSVLTRQRNVSQQLQDVLMSFQFQTLEMIVQSSSAHVYKGQNPALGINARLEGLFHNSVHNRVSGWLASGGSPRDPLFFMLHANVDRAWAEWQAKFNRFDASQIMSYPDQGTYPGGSASNGLRKGSFADDEMWPWSRDSGNGTAGDTLDDWPDSGFDMPTSPAGYAPNGPPTPASMVDYLGMLSAGDSHGACYDHIGYFGTVN